MARMRYRVPAPAVRRHRLRHRGRKVNFFETMSARPQHLSRLLAKVPGGRFFLSRREADKVGTTGSRNSMCAPPA